MKQPEKHGMSFTPEYAIWTAMKRRCYNRNSRPFKWYGGRGITVCQRWLDKFANFFEDMGPRPAGLTLERKDNNAGYTPENCTWASQKAQMNNTRNNRVLSFAGETKTLAQWSEHLGLDADRLRARVDRLNIPVDVALGKLGKLRGDGSRIEQATYEHDGQVRTLGEWAIAVGVRYGTIWGRLKRGACFADAIQGGTKARVVAKSPHMVTYCGETKTIADWCRLLGLPYARTAARITKLKMPLDVAFSAARRTPTGLRHGERTW